MLIKSKLILFIVFTICFFCAQTGFADNKDKVVAKGGDFVMTEGFVRAFQEYYAQRGHTTTREFLVDAALRDKLFAHQEMDLADTEQPVMFEKYSQEYIGQVVDLSENYVFRLLNNYPVDDKVVLSYYRSYPEKFYQNGNQDSRSPFSIPRIEQPMDQDKLFPLDDQLGKLISLRVAASKRQEIVSREIQRLKEKLEIKII